MSGYSIIDRRKNPKGKNLPNRQRFIQRTRQQIRDRLRETFNRRSITSDEDQEVVIGTDGIEEPNFQYDRKSGKWQHVLPGNQDFVPGDTIPKPSGSGSGRGGSKAGQGEEEDSFAFSLTKEEYLDIIFEDLELPDLVKQSARAAVNFERRRAGTTKDGSASNLDLARSLRNSLGRRIALAFPLDRQIQELEERILTETDTDTKRSLIQELEDLRARRLTVAYIDPVDIRYKRYERVPVPNSQAVMFCLMDVSGSMTEIRKEIAKRFFLLLYLFLQRKYDKVEIVFVRHTDTAKEVDEEEFFYSTDSGGTVISTGLDLTLNIVRERYDPGNWNLYCVQASDGDNDSRDNYLVIDFMHKLLPLFQYYVYAEVNESNPSVVMHEFFERESAAKLLGEIQDQYDNLKIIELGSADDVVPIFRQVFARNDQK